MRVLCLFEDKKAENFHPLSLTRPVYELRCGITTLREKLCRISNEKGIHLFCRAYLSEVTSQRSPKDEVNNLRSLRDRDLLFVNGRLLLFDEEIKLEGEEEVGVCAENIVYARLNKKTFEKVFPAQPEEIEEALLRARKFVRVKEVKLLLLEYLWDLVNYNSQAIESDFKLIGRAGIKGRVDKGAHLLNPSQIYLGEGARIEAGVVLNAEEGPIYIGERARIRPPTIIDGPGYIGRETIVDGAKIRGGCSIGPVCRVAGEIEQSIFHAYSNKHHDGFIGHSYIGEWVNLGALTTTSDLKNTYGNVKVYLKGKKIDTGEMKVGSFIGDHTKTGIGTLLSTGCVIGVGSNVFGGGSIPQFVPSFSWGGEEGFIENRLDKALEVSRTVMARRNIRQTDVQRNLLRKVYELTREERNYRYRPNSSTASKNASTFSQGT